MLVTATHYLLLPGTTAVSTVFSGPSTCTHTVVCFCLLLLASGEKWKPESETEIIHSKKQTIVHCSITWSWTNKTRGVPKHTEKIKQNPTNTHRICATAILSTCIIVRCDLSIVSVLHQTSLFAFLHLCEFQHGLARGQHDVREPPHLLRTRHKGTHDVVVAAQRRQVKSKFVDRIGRFSAHINQVQIEFTNQWY